MPEEDPISLQHIRQARSVRGVPPGDYQVQFQSIGMLLDRRAAEAPDKEFLISYDENSTRTGYTYAAFNRRVNQMANYLRHELGVQHGERVATLAYNHPTTVFCYFACWKLGATVAPQNISEDDQRIAFILRNALCRVALVRPEYYERVARLREDVPNLERLVVMDDDQFLETLARQPETFEAPTSMMLEDECLLVYTSGTTGAPKGVQLIQYNLLVDAQSIRDWQQVTPDQRWMCILPIHHVNGMIVTLVTPLFCGGSVVLNRAFKASLFWRRISDEQVHIVSLVPTILQFLSEARENTADYRIKQLRYVICGAGTLAISVARRFEQTFGVPVLHGYGLSETTCYSCFLPVDLSPEEHRRWIEDYGYPSIGVPISVNEMEIHDAEGNRLPDGERGEIVIRGHNVMIGYFQRPDANAETFKHGWFRSGDEGFIQRDAAGRPFFFISGRLKELINRGGVKYSPFEIEEVLLQIPGVKVGLAVAFPNTWYGEEVGAYIVPEPNVELSDAAVLAFCREHMPFAKSPKVVVFGTEVPVTTTGKYQRLRLQELFGPWSETQFRG